MHSFGIEITKRVISPGKVPFSFHQCLGLILNLKVINKGTNQTIYFTRKIQKHTSRLTLYVEDDNRRQLGLHNFSSYLDGQARALFHLYPTLSADKWLPKQLKTDQYIAKH